MTRTTGRITFRRKRLQGQGDGFWAGEFWLRRIQKRGAGTGEWVLFEQGQEVFRFKAGKGMDRTNPYIEFKQLADWLKRPVALETAAGRTHGPFFPTGYRGADG